MRQRLQGILIGVVIGCLITGGIVLSESFEAIRENFTILINGNVWTTDKPVVTIDGSTYLPLRAMGDALGVKVNWNSDLNRVEIGELRQNLKHLHRLRFPNNQVIIQGKSGSGQYGSANRYRQLQ